MPTTEPKTLDYRALMRKVERFVQTLERSDDPAETVHRVAAGIVGEFRHELGIFGGRLYRRSGDVYKLEAIFPEAKQVEGISVSRSYSPLDRVLEDGIVYMRHDDPEVDPDLEDQLGVRDFAAITVGDDRYVLAFDVAPGPSPEEILFSLGILRHTINEMLRHERIAGVFDEARRIQVSILPRREPEFGGFDIHGRSEPMESVGGDFFDYIPITDKILGMAIADVSGHGLPAALQVRDIYTGLRMGLARDFKIVRTVERLNGIIHESTLTSRFVSMFYGEVELNGLFIYVNAGHPAPFRLRRDGGFDDLDEGGAVLGPLAEATYERGVLRLEPGELIVLYTDGIVETTQAVPGGRPLEFGVDRLKAAAARHRHRSAAEIVEAIFSAVDRYAADRSPRDDRTVVVLKVPEEG